ncbi:glutathione synthase [Ensifer sp. ENS07]|uniref:glutathione synthetase n=1 Tax=Ensifer sp. ENS07 TaxID=2769274 RepID=UPI001784B61F|nr:glutathione synthetase [Ensifer sp. ENS07]MBD9639937.1 glutathione synthase [Ensifer sp. ENS07]
MRIAFLVNAIETERPSYTTTSLALAALARGHEVLYITPGDFILGPDDALMIRAAHLGDARPKKSETLLRALIAPEQQRALVNVEEVDVLFLRNDPSLDADTRPWAAHAGANFGRLAAERGTIVVNDPCGLALAQDKLYFQDFPAIVRPTTLISKDIEEIRAFIDDHSDGVIIKPLQGSGGKNVFRVGSSTESNLNQIIDAVGEVGYLIAQCYLPKASEGDTRLFLMNGRPLQRGDVYAAFRRVPAKGDVRSNIHARGTPKRAHVTKEMLAIAETLRPKLVEDGMFLVGLDIVGDKLLEINVFTPGGLQTIRELYDVDFCEDILESLENKIATRKTYRGALNNRILSTH